VHAVTELLEEETLTTSVAGTVGIRVLAGATAAFGSLLVLQPRGTAKRFSGSGAVPDDVIVRVLGGRQVVQGVVQFTRPTPGLVLAGVAVDVLHLLSMVAAAVIWPTYRRPAVASAAIAGASVGAGVVILSTGR
jgi:hypothetical protein